jgi:hypothetical protein
MAWSLRVSEFSVADSLPAKAGSHRDKFVASAFRRKAAAVGHHRVFNSAKR